MPFRREESYTAQIIEDARVKGWWVCSHEEAARIMGKTVAQTLKMWEVNTQASKVWTLQGGEPVCEIWGPSRLQTPEALKLPRGPWSYKIGIHEALLRSLAPG